MQNPAKKGIFIGHHRMFDETKLFTKEMTFCIHLNKILLLNTIFFMDAFSPRGAVVTVFLQLDVSFSSDVFLQQSCQFDSLLFLSDFEITSCCLPLLCVSA